MEAGIKKLWSRKKSWGSVDQPFHQRNPSMNNSTGGQSQTPVPTTRDGRPSMSSLRHLERPFSRDKLGASRDVSSTPAGDNPRPSKSGPRIQPMLVGISRPDTENVRPDTSGSFQTAVQKAADSVNYRPSETSVGQSAPIKKVQNHKSISRHVDIFSVAASIPTYSSSYNEEIAERNLDTYRLVLENTPYVYDPSSKYQEEVAIRNAYLPYRSRTSTDTLRDAERSASVASRSMRNIASTQPSGTHSYRPSTDSSSRAPRSSHDQSSSHYRSLSQRSQDSTQMPATVQDNSRPTEPEAEQGLNIISGGPYSPVRATGQNYSSREARMSTIAEGLPYETRPQFDIAAPISRDSGHASTAFSDYKAPIAEHSDRTTGNRNSAADYSLSPGMSSEAMFGPPSTRSIASARKIVLGNRTIMDLTADDSEIFSETSSIFGYSNYSPMIEQAKSDAFRRIQPSQIHTEERRGSGDPARLLQRTIRVDTAPVANPDPDATPTASNPQLARAASTSSGFSPISTVASWSPRSSALITKQVEPVSMTARVTAALEAANALKEIPAPSTSKKGDETPTVRERVATFENNAERGISPPQRTVTPGAPTPSNELSPIDTTRKVTPGASAPSNEIGMINTIRRVTPPPQLTSSMPDVEVSINEPVLHPAEPERQITATKVVRPIPKLETEPIKVEDLLPIPTVNITPAKSDGARTPPKHESVPVKLSTKKTQATGANGSIVKTAQIYASPESIKSIAPAARSDNFGVRTRDFALSPRENDMPVKKAVVRPRPAEQVRSSALTPKPETKKKTSRAPVKSSTPIVAKPQEPSFDEEAFARKRAEAKAALEKLQRSLSEDFLSLPDRATIKDKGKKRESDSTPAAPPLAFPPTKRDSVATTSSSQRGENEKPPPSSYRNSRGEQQQQRTSLTSTRSLSTGSQSSRRAPAPSTLKNVEPAINPVHQSMLSPALLQAMQMSSKPPKSPGEISLSSFPVPSSSRPPSQPDIPAGYHSHTNSFVGIMKRRNSTKSQTSTTSAFSIPYHMVPGRVSSVRDPVPEEVDPIWG